MVKKSTKDKKDKQNLVWRVLGAVLVFLQFAVSVMLIVSMLNMGFVASWVIVLVVVILLALFGLNLFVLVIKRDSSVVGKVICAVIAVICIIGGCFAMRFTDAFNDFLSKVTELKPEKKAYSVIVEEESEINEVQQLKNKGVGFLKTDDKAAEAEKYLQSVVKVDAGFYDDVKVLAEMLDSEIVDAIVLETDRMEMVKEELNLLDDTRVIYTFEIELSGDTVEVSDKEVTKEPFIVYISGSDSRDGVKATARSDVNIIAVVNPQEGKILLASIPRDMYVQLHSTTGLKDKLTHAGVYGINMSKTTIEDFLGIQIDHTIKVSFDTVVKVVDELDGIEIDSDQEMHLKSGRTNEKCDFKVGKQMVDGECALRFARERKSYERGDRHRGENQQQVLTSIIGKLSSSRDYLLKVPAILEIAADSFETSLERDDIVALIRMQLENSVNWQVESVAVDGSGAMEPTYSMGANLPLYVMIPYEESVQNVKNKINQYLLNNTAVEGETVDE